jgi:hypothetical protein
MQQKRIITTLILLIALVAIIATTLGIFSTEGPGNYLYTSIRGKAVTIYGKGLYKDMSAEVAPQGIAQDYITLFIGVPLLLISLFAARRGSVKGLFLLSGTLGYFFVTYLFYMVMGMYNMMFLGYVFLAGVSFYSFVMTLFYFDKKQLPLLFSPATPVRPTGSFLIFNAIAIALLWLSITVTPLLDGSIIPNQVEHYTTLIVQGLDLAILLPAAIIVAVLFIRKRPLGYLLCPVYFIFLSLLMTALTAKIVAMAMLGYNVIPVIFIIPVFNILSIICTAAILRHIRNNQLQTGEDDPTMKMPALQKEGYKI